MKAAAISAIAVFGGIALAGRSVPGVSPGTPCPRQRVRMMWDEIRGDCHERPHPDLPPWADEWDIKKAKEHNVFYGWGENGLAEGQEPYDNMPVYKPTDEQIAALENSRKDYEEKDKGTDFMDSALVLDELDGMDGFFSKVPKAIAIPGTGSPTA